MSPEKQCIAIAETHGLPNIHFVDHVLVYGGEYPDVRSVPDYPNDLNAMHEAEKVLDKHQKGVYYNRLCEVVWREDYDIMERAFNMVTPSAAQRAEAFLRTVGKWEEA